MTRKLLDSLIVYRAEIRRLEEKLDGFSYRGRMSVAERLALFWQRRYYARKKARLCATVLCVEKALDGMQEPLYGIILRYKFLDDKTIEQISELLNYSPRHMHRIYAAAVEEFERL